jgi:hypothetical protein
MRDSDRRLSDPQRYQCLERVRIFLAQCKGSTRVMSQSGLLFFKMTLETIDHYIWGKIGNIIVRFLLAISMDLHFISLFLRIRRSVGTQRGSMRSV